MHVEPEAIPCLGRPVLRRHSVAALAPWAIIAAFAISCSIWDWSDQRVWPWDQAAYGEWTLKMWGARLHGLDAWIQALTYLNAGQPPALTWIAQFFAPLGGVTGSYEFALLMANVLASTCTLALVYLTCRRLGADILSASAGVVLCGGSGIMLSITTTYMTEALHATACTTMMFAALHADRRSLLRTFALCLAAVSFSFLVKSSSITFVAPMLTYATVAVLISRGGRARTQPLDFLFLMGAGALLGVSLLWYQTNWSRVVEHFISSTTDTRWGHSVQILEKLKFWLGNFADAYSPYKFFTAGLALMFVAGLCVAVVRLMATAPKNLLVSAVRDGSLYVLAVLGMIAATLLAFSLQVNEDIRFLAPTIPPGAVLFAWSVSQFKLKVIRLLLCAVVTVSAVVNHAYAFGFDPLRLGWQHWSGPVERDARDKARLEAAVRRTCIGVAGTPPVTNFIAASYPALNANSIAFYAVKLAKHAAPACLFRHSSDEPDPDRVIELIHQVRPLYIVAINPNAPPSWKYVNAVAPPVATRLLGDPLYRVLADPPSGLLLFQISAPP